MYMCMYTYIYICIYVHRPLIPSFPTKNQGVKGGSGSESIGFQVQVAWEMFPRSEHGKVDAMAWADAPNCHLTCGVAAWVYRPLERH